MKADLSFLVATSLSILTRAGTTSKHCTLTLKPAFKDVPGKTFWARARAAAAATSAPKNCSSPLLAWYDKKVGEMEMEEEKLEEFSNVLLLPFLYRHCISQSQEGDYFGVTGDYTDLITSQQERLKAFWSTSDSTLKTDDIVVLGVHGTVFQDKAKLVPTLEMMFDFHNSSEANMVADEIQRIIRGIPKQFENPLLSFDGFAFPAGGPPFFAKTGAHCRITADGTPTQDSILIGDGILIAVEDIFGENASSESVSLFHAHEYGHQMQYEIVNSVFETPSWVPITVVIQLDNSPTETGWMISSSNAIPYYVYLPGSYTTPRALIQETVYVDAGKDFWFTISDTLGNGLEEGYYEVYFGVDTNATDDLIISGEGNFGYFMSKPFDSGSLKRANMRKEMMADALSAYFLAHPRGGNLSAASLDRVFDGFFAAGDCLEDESARGTPWQKQCVAIWAAALARNGDPISMLDPRSFRDRYDKDLKRIMELDETICSRDSFNEQNDTSAPMTPAPRLESSSRQNINQFAMSMVLGFSMLLSA